MNIRQNRASWDQVFMEMAQAIAKRSPDPDYQVGAIIVTPDNTVAGAGYNGAPRGIDQNLVPWDSEEKHFFIAHAEANAILNATQDLHGCRIYVILYPCFECMKMIIQTGIKEVVFLDDSKLKNGNVKFVWAKDLAEKAGIVLRQFQSSAE